MATIIQQKTKELKPTVEKFDIHLGKFDEFYFLKSPTDPPTQSLSIL